MRKLIALSFFIFFCFSAAADIISESELLALIQKDRNIASCGHYPYNPAYGKSTPAPAGYKPFYVSHLGRHGSRYQGHDKGIARACNLLDEAYGAGRLTLSGDSLRTCLNWILARHNGMCGMLTQRGISEHREIAGRMCARVPGVFNQKGRNKVNAISSDVHRCVQSMASFCTEVKGFNPDLEIAFDSGLKIRSVISPKIVDTEMAAAVKACVDSLIRNTVDADALNGRFGQIGDAKDWFDVFSAAQSVSCMDDAPDALGFFTDRELLSFARIRNIHFCSSYGKLGSYGHERLKTIGGGIAKLFVSDADAAIRGNGICADLRFGHDGGVGPFLSFLGVDGFDVGPSIDASVLFWQSWKYICMASNVQFEFYRNRGGDVIVKILRNEEETSIPSLKPFSGPYYRWTELRAYILELSGEKHQLPEYYNAYLDGKAAFITALQKKEADGFYFWTDPHYPENTDNVPEIIEFLRRNGVAERRIVSGGDLGVNGPDYSVCIDGFNSAALRLGGSAPLYSVRGNHDITNYTGRKREYERITMPQSEISSFLRSHTWNDAVYDAGNPSGAYFYFDSPSARIRYIALDTTDSVAENGVVYGMSDKQIEWLTDTAVKGAPKGWDLYFLTHVPLSADHTNVPSIVEAGKLASTLAPGRVIMVQSGHRHNDLINGIGDVWQYVTSCDRLYSEHENVKLPYLSPAVSGRVAGNPGEQCLDYVSVSKDHRTVTVARIGFGADKIFHIGDVVAGNGSVKLRPTVNSPKWYVFDSEGFELIRLGNGTREWKSRHENASVSDTGEVTTKGTGRSIVVAAGDDGTLEFFMVRGGQRQ